MLSKDSSWLTVHNTGQQLLVSFLARPKTRRNATQPAEKTDSPAIKSRSFTSHQHGNEVGTSFFFASGIEVGEGGMGAIPARYSRAFVYFC